MRIPVAQRRGRPHLDGPDDRGAPARAARALRRRGGDRRRRVRRPGARMGRPRPSTWTTSTRTGSTASATRSSTSRGGAADRSAAPILDQRGHWFANDAYDKAGARHASPCAGARVSTDARTSSSSLDPDLRLIHLHRMDYEICRRRHRTRERRRWNEHDIARGLGAPTTGSPRMEEFDRWFREDSDVGDVQIELEETGGTWRGSSWRGCAGARPRLLSPEAALGARAVAARGALTTRWTATWAARARSASRRRRSVAPTTPRSPGSSYESLDFPEFDLCAPLGGHGDATTS